MYILRGKINWPLIRNIHSYFLFIIYNNKNTIRYHVPFQILVGSDDIVSFFLSKGDNKIVQALSPPTHTTLMASVYRLPTHIVGEIHDLLFQIYIHFNYFQVLHKPCRLSLFLLHKFFNENQKYKYRSFFIFQIEPEIIVGFLFINFLFPKRNKVLCTFFFIDI